MVRRFALSLALVTGAGALRKKLTVAAKFTTFQAFGVPGSRSIGLDVVKGFRVSDFQGLRACCV